jgi:hypothetical protein
MIRHRAGLAAAAGLLAAVAADLAATGQTLFISGSVNKRRVQTSPTSADIELKREIATHNEAVDRRRAEKKAAKRNRKTQEPTT